MILSDRDIKKALADGSIKITPQPDYSAQLGSCSIDLRLGNTFRVFNHSRVALIDTKDPTNADAMTSELTITENEPFILQPGDFVLATTMETLSLPNDLLGRLEGRSSLGRLGIVVHSTASVFDPGWDGMIVMELGNLGRMPVALYAGMRICALTFEQLTTAADVPYSKKKGAKYVHQQAPIASRINRES